MTLSYILRLSSFLVLLTTCASVSAFAQSSDRPVKPNLLMFIAKADVSPYFIENQGYPDSGLFVDILRAVIQPLGYSYTPMHLPDKRGWDMLAKGEVDIYASAKEWTPEPERYLWTDPILSNEDVLLHLTASTHRYTGPESLFGKTIAGIKGFIYPALEPYFQSGEIIRLETHSTYALLDVVALRRAEAAIVSKTEILWMFRNDPTLEPERFRVGKNPIGQAYTRFIFPNDPKWIPVVKQFNQRIKTLREDGTLEAILNKYR